MCGPFNLVSRTASKICQPMAQRRPVAHPPDAYLLFDVVVGDGGAAPAGDGGGVMFHMTKRFFQTPSLRTLIDAK